MAQESTAAGNPAPAVPMTAEQRATFDRDGFLIIRGALRPDEAADARDAIDRMYAAMAKAGSRGPDGSMHLLSAVANCPQVAGLTDHPTTFPYVWSGGRQNREIETTPRLSVKLASWLSDVSEPGRGNLKVVPGSHVANWIDGPPRRDIQWRDPAGASEVTAGPGDSVPSRSLARIEATTWRTPRCMSG